MAFFFKFLIFSISVLELQIEEPRRELSGFNSSNVIPIEQPFDWVLAEPFWDFWVTSFYIEIVVVYHVDQGPPIVAVEEHG